MEFRLARLLAVAAALLSVSPLAAQSVRWEPSSGSLAHGQLNALQLIFEDCRPTASLSLPTPPRVEISETNQTGTSTQIENGRTSTVSFIICTVRPQSRDPVTIPAFTVETDKGRLTVPAASFTVGDAMVGQSSLSIDAVSNARLTVPREVWAGEVFPVTYTLNTIRRYFHGLGNQFEWDTHPLVAEQLSRPQGSERMENGERRVIVTAATRAMVKEPGTHTLNAATASVQLATGTTAFGFFNRPNVEQYMLTTNRPTLTVKPLPAQAPPTFRGAVGQFKLESKVVPREVVTGEPVTWTVTLRGSGNWPDISSLPPREVAKDFRPVQTQPKRDLAPDSLFDGSLSEDVVLVPTQPGTYTIGPLSWSFFDPAKGSYETITTEAVTVTVTGAAPPATTGNPEASRVSPTLSNTPLVPPALPAPLPGDPLDGSDHTRAPMRRPMLIGLFFAPVLPLLALWFLLALRRAQKSDPFRVQREAHVRLQLTLAAVAAARHDRVQAASLLQQWQRDAAVLWQLPHVAPTPVEFRRLAENNRDLAHAAEWSRLVDEVERAMYRRDYDLPADWVSRAQAALSLKPVHRFSPLSLFRARNLLPFAAALALAAGLMPAPLDAASPDALYNKGDFAGAEQAWRKQVAAHPTDWKARHNLALALAQLNRWNESAAYATAAFVQQPGNEAVRRQMSLALKNAGYTSIASTPRDLGSRTHAATRLFSPSAWQCVLIGASCAFCLGIAGLLVRAYTGGGTWWTMPALFLCPSAMLTALIAGYALLAYSPLDDERAVLVWKQGTLKSIPTDVDTAQKTSPISPGSIAIVDRSFPGWLHLRFSDGQTGWLRQDDVVAIWK